jgi:uncharacterized membrane protein
VARPSPHALTAVLVVVLAGANGCKATTLEERACPPDGTPLRYATFGAPFLARHCQSCHGASSSRREGAPSSFDFGTQADVVRHKDRIFVRSAEGNTTMPPGPDDPTREEREALAEWLACGAP